MDFDAILGARVSTLRKKAGISQTKMVVMLGDCAVSYQQLQKYEKGQNRIPVQTLHRIAQILNTSVDALLKDVEEPRMFQEYEIINDRTEKLVSLFNQIETDKSRSLAVGVVSLISRLDRKGS